jgi:hypothetical protein
LLIYYSLERKTKTPCCLYYLDYGKLGCYTSYLWAHDPPQPPPALHAALPHPLSPSALYPNPTCVLPIETVAAPLALLTRSRSHPHRRHHVTILPPAVPTLPSHVHPHPDPVPVAALSPPTAPPLPCPPPPPHQPP